MSNAATRCVLADVIITHSDASLAPCSRPSRQQLCRRDAGKEMMMRKKRDVNREAKERSMASTVMNGQRV